MKTIRFWVGNYASPGQEGVSRYRYVPLHGFEKEAGYTGLTNPSFLLEHPALPVLYTVEETDGESFVKFPDLLLMDGGRGQVNIAEEVLESLGIQVPVCGMVKDDNHRTRGIYYQNVELPIDTRSEGFKLITRVQDEAHRFAIEYHRSLRTKAQVHSVLDEIPGIGEKRRRALMKAFSSIDELKAADVSSIAALPEIPENVAKGIYEYLHREEGNGQV